MAGKDGWIFVRKSTDTKKAEGTGRTFIRYVLFFLVLLLALYLYFMLADLSTAPKYVYSQF